MTKKQFDKLTPAKQRVFVAQDVLLQLKAEKYVAKRGYYVSSPTLCADGWSNNDASAQQMIKEEVCHVCAKGALVCSYVRNFNNMQIKNLPLTANNHPELNEIFGRRLWNIIEALFEGWIFDKNGFVNQSMLHNNTPDYPYNHKNKRFTIESLMKNIIRNNGKLNYNGILIG